jgi:hypothetical protein
MSKKEKTPQETYDDYLKLYENNLFNERQAQQNIVFLEGCLQALEKTNGYDRQKVLKRIKEEEAKNKK